MVGPLFENFDWTQIKAALDVAKAVLPPPSVNSGSDEGTASSDAPSGLPRSDVAPQPADQRVEVSGDHNNITIMFSSPVDAGRDVSFNQTNVASSIPRWDAELNHVVSVATNLDPVLGREELERMTAESILLLELLVGKLEGSTAATD